MDLAFAIQAALANPHKRPDGRQNFPPYLDRQVDYYRLFVAGGWLYLVDLGEAGGRVIRREDGAEIDLKRCSEAVQREIHRGLRYVEYHPNHPPILLPPPQPPAYRGAWQRFCDWLGL